VKDADSEVSYYYLFVRRRRYCATTLDPHMDHNVKSSRFSDVRTRHHAFLFSFNNLLRSRTWYVLHPCCDAVQRRRLVSVENSHPHVSLSRATSIQAEWTWIM